MHWKLVCHFVVMGVALLCAIPVYADDLTVGGAYKALNHKQTTFDKKASLLADDEAKYLDHLFFVTDLAFRERMLMLRYAKAHETGRYIESYNKEIDNLLASFEFITPPSHILKQVQDLIIASIKEQKAFFNEWHNASEAKARALIQTYASHQLVQASHMKLMQAYQLLKSAFGNEAAHNQQSFYDHLCVLDFI